MFVKSVKTYTFVGVDSPTTSNTEVIARRCRRVQVINRHLRTSASVRLSTLQSLRRPCAYITAFTPGGIAPEAELTAPARSRSLAPSTPGLSSARSSATPASPHRERHQVGEVDHPLTPVERRPRSDSRWHWHQGLRRRGAQSTRLEDRRWPHLPLAGEPARRRLTSQASSEQLPVRNGLTRRRLRLWWCTSKNGCKASGEIAELYSVDE